MKCLWPFAGHSSLFCVYFPVYFMCSNPPVHCCPAAIPFCSNPPVHCCPAAIPFCSNPPVHCCPAVQYGQLTGNHEICDSRFVLIIRMEIYCVQPVSFMETTKLLSEWQVSTDISSWNGVVPLHDPPGTWKRSFCKAETQKLAVRISHHYTHGKLSK